MKKYALCILLLFLVIFGLPVAAATAENGYVAIELFDGKAVLLDSEGEVQAEMENVAEDDGFYDFTVTPGKTYYLCMGDPKTSTSVLQSGEAFTEPVEAGILTDSSLFRFRNQKSGSGAGLVSVAQYNEKNIGDSGRCSWLQFVVANTAAGEELKATCNLSFCARQDDIRYNEGDMATVIVTLYINTPIKKNGSDFSTDEKSAYQAVSGEKNEIVWENVAKLSFATGTDPGEMETTLETSGRDYWNLSDFSDAELFVRDFSEMTTLQANSRALLSLFNPWEVRGSETNPENCRIYERDDSGKFNDITALFTYTNEDGVGCWQMKTRKLGCYIISDRELNLSGHREKMAGAFTGEASSVVEKIPEPLQNPLLTHPYPKKVPNTGKIFFSMQ